MLMTISAKNENFINRPFLSRNPSLRTNSKLECAHEENIAFFSYLINGRDDAFRLQKQ